MMTKSEEKLNDVFGIEDARDVIDGHSVDVETGEIVVSKPQQNLPAEPQQPFPLQKSQQEKKEDEEFKKDATDDYELARNRLKDLMDKGDELLDMAMRNVEMSEDPEAIEGAAKLIGNLSSMNKHLMELNKQRQDIFMKTRASGIISKALQENPGSNLQLNQVNQNISFVGTSTDLQKLLADMKKEGNN